MRGKARNNLYPLKRRLQQTDNNCQDMRSCTHLIIEVYQDGADWLKDVLMRHGVRVTFVPRVQQFDVARCRGNDVTNDFELFRGNDGWHRAIAILLSKQ